MNARQDTYATYYDKKVLDDPLKVGDLFYVYLPRNKNVKLAKKWTGPHKIVFADHPVYHVEIVKDNGTVTKVYTRDKLKRVPKTIHIQRESDSEQENEDRPEYTQPDLTQSKDDTDSSRVSRTFRLNIEDKGQGEMPGTTYERTHILQRDMINNCFFICCRYFEMQDLLITGKFGTWKMQSEGVSEYSFCVHNWIRVYIEKHEKYKKKGDRPMCILH